MENKKNTIGDIELDFEIKFTPITDGLGFHIDNNVVIPRNLEERGEFKSPLSASIPSRSLNLNGPSYQKFEGEQVYFNHSKNHIAERELVNELNKENVNVKNEVQVIPSKSMNLYLSWFFDYIFLIVLEVLLFFVPFSLIVSWIFPALKREELNFLIKWEYLYLYLFLNLTFLFLIYLPLCDYSFEKSLGKKLFQLKVTKNKHEKLSFFDHLKINGLYFLSLLFLGIPLFFIDVKKMFKIQFFKEGQVV
jgi:hypothetical protein